MGAGLCRRAGTAGAASSAALHRVMAGGRDLHQGQGCVNLPVSRGRQLGPDDRLPALGPAGCGRGQAVLPQGAGPAAHGEPAHDHRGQEPGLPACGAGD